MRLASTVILFSALALSAPAMAQTPGAAETRVKGFPIVYVTDPTGREIKGKLVSWNGSTIVIRAGGTDRTFGPGEMVRVDLRGDSLKNGALIGAGFGLFMGAVSSGIADCPGRGGGGCAGARVGFTLLGTAFYAAIGTAFDALIPGRTPLWHAGSSENSGRGLTVTVSPEGRSAFVGWRIK